LIERRIGDTVTLDGISVQVRSAATTPLFRRTNNERQRVHAERNSPTTDFPGPWVVARVLVRNQTARPIPNLICGGRRVLALDDRGREYNRQTELVWTIEANAACASLQPQSSRLYTVIVQVHNDMRLAGVIVPFESRRIVFRLNDPSRLAIFRPRLRQHLRSALGLYFYEKIASLKITHDKITVRTTTRGPNFPYQDACQAVANLANASGRPSAVEVRDTNNGLEFESSRKHGRCHATS
jgi:hypothetical protein